MSDDIKERKIITNKVCDFEGDKISIEDIQNKIDETKKAYKYDWVKFYIGNPTDVFALFTSKLCLNVERYETSEEEKFEAEKDKRFKLFNELKNEFEPIKPDVEKSEVENE